MRSWASSPPARRAWLLGRMTDILFRRTQKTIFTAAPVRLRSCAPHWRPQRPCAAAWQCAGPARTAASGRGRPRAAPLAGPGAAPLQPRAHSALAQPVPAGACTPCRHAHSHHWLSGECQNCEGAFCAQPRLQATANVRHCCCVSPLGSQPGSDAPGSTMGLYRLRLRLCCAFARLRAQARAARHCRARPLLCRRLAALLGRLAVRGRAATNCRASCGRCQRLCPAQRRASHARNGGLGAVTCSRNP